MTAPTPSSNTRHRAARDGAALLGGCLYPFAFAPHDHPALLIAALALLFFAWADGGPGRSAWRGYLFGLGQFGLGVSWVFISMHDYGGASTLEAGGLTALFVAGLSLYMAVPGVLAGMLGRYLAPAPRLIAAAAVWTLGEWFRGWFLTGFPWLLSGSSQIDTLFGQAMAPIAGVFGVGFVAALATSLLLRILFSPRHTRLKFSALLLALVFGCIGLSKIDWSEPSGPPLRVALLQGNIPQDQKWQADSARTAFGLYAGLTREHWDAQLIIWPETAIPAFFHQIEHLWLDELAEEAKRHGTDVLIGIPVSDATGGSYFNGLVRLGPAPQTYLKRHLVPFGEYLPLRPVLGFVLDILEIPLADFAAGRDDQPLLQASGYKLATSICYEDIFADIFRSQLPDATFLVNVTNDAWFGDSAAPHQHAQIARMRALESGRYLLRATNTGVTAVISPRGQFAAQAPVFQKTALVADIVPQQGITPYVRFGDTPAVIFALIQLILQLVLAHHTNFTDRKTYTNLE